MLTVNEIFYSIQGESTHAGKPCVFVRLTGCNLRCTYCDTRYAYIDGQAFEIDAVLTQVAGYECPLVEITGGEPLLQNDTPELVRRFLDKGYTVLVETNGSLDIGVLDTHSIRIVDIKCPSSGEAHANNFANLERLTEGDELKFVIGTREDYDYACMVLERFRGEILNECPIHFSPVFGKQDPELLAQWILDDRLKVRMNMQLHKIIWGPSARGV